ncbi:MAG: DNA-binding transcriptional regulator, partial [Firmicutes bacterium]|nr:DNA-binding transcriptional regulator [Bacillota bacterium]
GKTFIDVEKQTGASSATISRVNRCLKHGKGYRNIIEKMKKDHTLE